MTTVWSASASLSLGAIVAPTSANNGLFFKVTTAGTTGSSEPNWASVVGQTVYDNSVRYISFSSTFADLQSINPSAIIELFQLKLDSALHGASTIYYFHAGSNLNANNKIKWKGVEYLRFPIQASGFAFQKGQLPRPKLIVSNATGLISSILLDVNQITAGNDLTGATVTRIRTLAKFIDADNFADGVNSTADPSAEFPKEIYSIDRKSAETRETVEFELAAPTDLAGVRIPKRQATRSLFPAIGTFTQ
jgi:lambda family phage minor tail protein L|tara:strand:+ start:144 stop:890 length:747 start_codon:yes stop_codon:yes gene_type:complete